MHPRAILFVLVSLLAFLPSARALEFRLLSWSGNITGLNFVQGAKPVPVIAWDSALSPKYNYTGSAPLVLFREVVRDDKLVREPVASLPIPPGITHAILLLTASDAAGTSYTARWINDSPEVRRAQTITYENLSSYPVLIKVGDHELSIEPGKQVTRETDPAHRRLTLQIAAHTETGWELVVSQSQPVRPGLRTLVLLRDGRVRPDGIKERVDYLTFNDLPPPPTPPGQSVASR